MPVLIPVVTAAGGWLYAKYQDTFGDTDPATGQPRDKTMTALKLALIAYGAYTLWKKVR